MSIDRHLLGLYLRQWRQLGDRELFLETLTAAEALAIVGGAEPFAESGPGTGTAEDDIAAGPSSPPPKRIPSKPIPRTRSEPVPAPNDVPEAPPELVVLAREAAGCVRCRLHESRRSVVFGEGNPRAEVVVVGEAPGAREDATGRPFVGQAGQMLDLMLMSIGLTRNDVYICNVLKCRPPDNRNPVADEVATCSEYLHGQLDLIAPRVILAIGKFAAQTLAESDESIGRLRGKIHAYRGVPLVASYHPAYLLRSPQMTPAAWDDLQLLRRILDEQR